MVYRHRRILLSEVDRQCRFAMIAYADACSALERRDAERCWYSLQGLIAAAMQLHRLLWPLPSGSQSAVDFRGSLEVADDSPLNQPQLASALDVTSALESFGASRTSLSRPILSPSGLADPASSECVRCFDPETGVFTVFGNAVELPTLLSAIADLGQKAEEEQQHMRELV
jgi:hypothetical protein